MAYPVLTGAILVEANGAALNNAGQDKGGRVDNAIVVKQIREGQRRYPYISGQAWRRWWREVLYQDFEWTPSEVIREQKSAYTKGDPIAYAEDDLFGYMAARKRSGGRRNDKKEEEEDRTTQQGASGTYRRVSPLKNSLLISVLPNVITSDFGHFSRNLPPDTDIIPFEAEHYTTFLQGVFTISLADVGRFEVGEMRDISDELWKAHQSTQPSERVVRLSLQDRVKRVQDVVRALARLRGGARLARNLSDVTPVAVLVGFLDGGNAPFQRLFEPDEKNERVRLNLTRFQSVLNDYRDRLLQKESVSLYFGYRPTVVANEAEVLESFRSEAFRNILTVSGTPKDALEEAAQAVESIMRSLEG
ncbi:MAG: type I-B CRISPR-associated protein Cas7/Cst2/DevR [Armatimonadetes bacterium]|nr:type I-B CRISPR-associated protein Cas7/Cst2/DevR [Armatimonadota bacterium]